MYTNGKAYRDARDNIEHHFEKSNTVNSETVWKFNNFDFIDINHET